jgi:3-oxoacyl-[acyl-carrier protein] reductase
MTWTLISYSEVKLPLPAYRSDYIIGVAESEDGRRCMVQVDRDHVGELSVGIKGEVKPVDGPNGEINAFVQRLNKRGKGSKVALVTGSSRGIGRAIAIELAKSGIDIVINSVHNPQEGIEAVEEIKKTGRRAIYIQADVSDLSQVEEMIKEIINEFGKIDILVNNAGITMDKRLENMTKDQWDRVISINLTGVFNCTKSVIKYMQEQRGGEIINISSIVGETGNVGQANYSASKGGIIAFTKTVAKEYAGDGITVNAVAPGFIKTRMLEDIPKGVMQRILREIPLGRLGNPTEVARVVCLLASDDANYITGQVINVNGGMYM